MFAVIQTGGKQYKVVPGDLVYVEKLDAAQGDKITFDALMAEGEKGVVIGSPLAQGVKVEGVVRKQGKGEKIIVFKYKAKKNYRRKSGHRQPYTCVEITGIAGV